MNDCIHLFDDELSLHASADLSEFWMSEGMMGGGYIELDKEQMRRMVKLIVSLYTEMPHPNFLEDAILDSISEAANVAKQNKM